MGREIGFFEQASLSGRTLIANLSPGAADAIFKILYLIGNILKNVTIRNSELSIRLENKPNTFLYANLEKLLGKNVNLSFLTSNESLSKLTKIKGNGNVLILEDVYQGRYMVTNGKVHVNLTKYTGPSNEPSLPDASDCKVIGAVIETDEASLILDSLKKPRFVTFYIFGDQLGIVNGDNGEIFCFNENSFFEYAQREPSWTFRAYAFMEIPSPFMRFRILRCDAKFWLHTSAIFGFDMIIEQFEILDFVEGGETS
jgi:hypothetical protein